MAVSVKLARAADFASDVDSIDLQGGLSATDGIILAKDGWQQQIAPASATEKDRIQEVFTLHIQGSDTDDLALKIQSLDAKIQQVKHWLDNPSLEPYQVWLRVQANGETNARQALVYNISSGPGFSIMSIETQLEYTTETYILTVERSPFWEAPYPYPTTTDKTGIDTLAGNVQLSESIYGDVPARLAHLSITPNGSATIGDIWLGWKTSRFGAAANFVSVWSLDKSSYLAGIDTTVQTDATAYDGKNQTCTFATTATLAQRVLMRVVNISADHPADQRGSYHVLMRARMSDSSVARARIGHSFVWVGAGIVQPIYRSRQVISGTTWKLYEMGTVQIPSERLYGSFTIANYGVTIEAERISGSGSLIMDCLVLIPIDDGAVKLSAAADLSQNLYAHVYQDASMSAIAEGEVSGNIALPIVQMPTNWALPANSEAPYLIFAAQGVTLSGSVTGETVDIAYSYIPRWRTLRGSTGDVE